MRTCTWLALLILAALHSAGNIAKPLHIDDTAYYYYARQIAEKPLDPYGFQVFWWHNPDPANEVLAPVALPSWWSLFLRIDGDQTWVWKLGMVPFSLLFIGSLYALFRRFARGLEMPLVWLTVLSPTFWPSLNLMLDIPSLALSLFALTLFMRACDRDSLGLAALAGLAAGLAMETKYTAFLTPLVMLLYAVLLGRFRLWPVAALVAAQVFLSWEALIALLYGQSHFLYHYRDRATTWDWREKLSLLLPLLGIVGSIGPALVLLGLRSVRVPWAIVAVAGLVGLGGYRLVAAIEDSGKTRLPLPTALFTAIPADHSYLQFQEVWFGAWGVALLLLLVAGVCLLLRLWPPLPRRFEGPMTPLRSWPRLPNRRTFWIIAFLMLWLCVEVAGYVALTPFPAVRRVMGVVVVCTMIVGCVAARTSWRRRANAGVWAIAVYGALIGAGFAALDWRDAQAEKEAVERAAAWIEQNGGGKVWFVGHWGFQFYAERAGMEALSPTQSELQPGDWLVFPWEVTRQSLDRDGIPCDMEQEIKIDDPIRLRTVMCYYLGYTAVENRPEPRVTVWIYRITGRCVPGYRKR